MNKNGKSPENDISLKILDEISRESRITQRSLSSELNIALGLVNTYLKRLAKKGYIKIKKGNMNKVKYVLTKKGFTYRVRLTYNYMHSSIDYFRYVRKKIDNTYRQMIDSGARNILIWGDGEVAELSYISLRGLPLKLVGVIDGKARQHDFFGHHIYTFEDIDNLNYDAILLTSFDTKEVERIRELGIDESKIYSL